MGDIIINTKTEVSADGVTWTTLFDSAVSWTYVETSEGRTYEVKKPSLSLEEQELEALIQEILSGIGVQDINEETIEINEALQWLYFYWKRERLIKKYEGTGNYNGFRWFQNKLKTTNITVEKLNSILLKIETLKTQTQYQTERIRDFLALIEISVKSELENRDTQVQIDEVEARADLLLIYAEIWLDLTWLNSAGEWLGAVATYWVGYVTDDPYLSEEAKLHLNEDLLAVASELNPSKKFKKLMNFGETVSKINKILFKIKKNQVDGIIIFTSDKIHDPLYSWINWKWVKKAYYDTEISKDFHWMEKVDNIGDSPMWTRAQIKVK